MQAVVTHPGGVLAGAASTEARRGLPEAEDRFETVVKPSAKLSGAERLAIYGRSYHARLLECFHSMFKALRHALGEELFDRFVLDYLEHHPPRSYTLHRLAEHFPEHLAATRPDADLPIEEREPWADFLVELARLEKAFGEIYDGPGNEGQTLPSEATVFALAPEVLLASRLAPAPCLHLFALRFPAHDFLQSVHRGEDPEMPAAAATFLAVHRREYQVRFHPLSPPQYALLQALDGRRTLTQAIHLAGETEPLEAAMARSFLRAWVAEGFFERVRTG